MANSSIAICNLQFSHIKVNILIFLSMIITLMIRFKNDNFLRQVKTGKHVHL